MKEIELAIPLTVKSCGWKTYRTVPEHEILSNLFKIKEEDISKITKLVYHPADDYRNRDIHGGGNIRVSCDGNGFAFAFFPDNTVKLCISPYQLYDRWLKVGTHRAETKEYDRTLEFLQTKSPHFKDPYGPFVEEPTWIAEGYWKQANLKGKSIVLTKIFIHD